MEENKYIKIAYKPFCNSEEIERIFNVKNSEDYLLKLRADEVVANDRIFRIIRNRYIQNESIWDFSEHFSTDEFEEYLYNIPDEFRNKSDLAHGFVFSNDANGFITRSDFGDIICVSESLRYFLFYMNLSFLTYQVEIPDDIRYRSMIIAIRTMLKTETLDFEQDPRGIIPKEVERSINAMVNIQLQFIIGHEFSHHFLNHLDKNKTVKKGLYRMFKNEREVGKEKEIYSYSQEQEFEADFYALDLLRKTNNLDSYYVQGAITFFGYLEIYESVSDYIFPPSSYFQTHPSPESRYKKIIQDFEEFTDYKFISTFIDSIKNNKKEIMEEIGYDIEKYEMYGSHYLAAPNTKWRGKELLDKVDFY